MSSAESIRYDALAEPSPNRGAVVLTVENEFVTPEAIKTPILADEKAQDRAAERDMRAIAVEWMKATGKAHPIFGHVNLKRPSHVRCVEFIAKMRRSKCDTATALSNIRINIGLDPDSLLAAADAWEEAR